MVDEHHLYLLLKMAVNERGFQKESESTEKFSNQLKIWQAVRGRAVMWTYVLSPNPILPLSTKNSSWE